MKNKILTVLCVLFGAMFVNSGLNKILHYIPVPEDIPEAMNSMMNHLVDIGWIMPLVAFVEIIGGILFVIPRTRFLAALMLCPILIGILLTHFSAAPEGLPMIGILLVIYIWVLIENKHKIKALLA